VGILADRASRGLNLGKRINAFAATCASVEGGRGRRLTYAPSKRSTPSLPCDATAARHAYGVVRVRGQTTCCSLPSRRGR
jgi:hypothetical protein